MLPQAIVMFAVGDIEWIQAPANGPGCILSADLYQPFLPTRGQRGRGGRHAVHLDAVCLVKEREFTQTTVKVKRQVWATPWVNVCLDGMPQHSGCVWKPAKNRLAADDDELRLSGRALTRPQDMLEVGALHSGRKSGPVPLVV